MTLIGALLGAGFAAGLLLVVSGLSKNGPAESSVKLTTRRELPDFRRRLALAAPAAAVVAVVTRWPVAALGAGALAWFSGELFGSKHARDRAVARTEAIASWTEMLRDTMSGAHGIEEAIITSAAVAPAAIRDEVTNLALRLEREPLDRSLRQFALDCAHPTADLVVTSLTLAAHSAVGDLVELLGTLAVAARDEAGMRLRVDAARARLRTAVRVIAAVTLAMAIGLVFLNRGYIDVYDTPAGQVVLAFVVALWGGALWWLARMGEFIAPERFLAVGDHGSDR
jgi:Flp pilus assembly protein TadB